MPKTNKRGATVGTARPVERPEPAIFPDQDLLVTGRGRLRVDQALEVEGVQVQAPLVHNWDVDGWRPFTNRRVSAQGVADVASVAVAGRGRITGHTGTGNGNNREVWMRDDTYWENSRIKSLWWGGSEWNSSTCTPQMGHVHRGKTAADGSWSGVVVSNNIFLTEANVVNKNVWGSSADTLTLTLGSGNAAATHTGLHRALTINSTQRFQFGTWINSHTVTPKQYLETLVVGDLVNINSNDSTFNATGVALTGCDAVAGSISHDEPTTTSTVAMRIDAGTLTPPVHKKFWPYWVLSELVGTTLRVKVWRYLDPEPDWGSSAHVQVVDFAGASNPLPNIAMPTGPGYCGFVSAHMRNDATIEYGYSEFTKLAVAA